MIVDDVINIFKNDWRADSEPVCRALKGLLIISKYLPTKGIEGAGHDIIYSSNIEDLIKAGCTEEDFIQLRDMGWHIEEGEYLAKFV